MKIFLSHSKNLNEDEIQILTKIKNELQNKYRQNLVLIDTYVHYADNCKKSSILHRQILASEMINAGLIVFIGRWRAEPRCVVEHNIAKHFGVACRYLKFGGNYENIYFTANGEQSSV